MRPLLFWEDATRIPRLSPNNRMETARKLQAAVLAHAKQDEEANLYPRLQAMLTAQENTQLSVLYEREFITVHPRRNPIA